MIKFPVVAHEDSNKPNSRKFIYSNNSCFSGSGVDGADLIPIDCGGRLIAPTVSVNELGKQLLKAAAEGNVDETKTLLNKGALFTADWLGTSPLHLAARNNQLEICEILLKAGISKDARTKVDKTSLHMAASEGHLNVVETLLDYGADPDCRDLLGMTPLHWACQNGHYDVIKAILKQFPQIDAVNKFELTPIDIAAQINRQDIVDLLNMESNEPISAVQHLTLELCENGVVEESNRGSISNSPIPLETILMEDTDNSIDPDSLNSDYAKPIENSNSFAESIRLLQEHGITMLPHEDNNILNTVMESGHSVVLTDVGRQVLNSLKETEKSNEKLITVRPDECLTLTTNNKAKNKNILKQINGRLVPKNMKRIVMKKNKLIPVASNNSGASLFKIGNSANNDMETVMTELIEAKKTIEEYKVKLFKKEQEVERYKQQLKLLMDGS